MKKLKFAIIGCGSIAQRHAEHIHKLAKLSAVCDIKIDRAKALAEKYSCEYYNNIDDLLKYAKDLDVLSVCTPNGLHAEHSIKALRAGINVLCEKPMALTVRDCEMMIHEAEKSNKRLFIVKQNRFNPPVIAVKNAIDSGKLGRIFSVQLNCFWNRNKEYYTNSDWKGTRELDGGPLFTQYSHFIDLLYWLVGDIKRAYSIIKNYAHQNIIEFEDTGVVILESMNGVICTLNYTINSFKQNMEGSITIFAENGTVKIGGQYLNILEYQNIENYCIENLSESGPPNDYGFYKGSMSNHDKVYENVIDVLQNNASIAINFLDGLKTVQIIEKIYNNIV